MGNPFIPDEIEDGLKSLFKPANVEAVNRLIQRAPVVLAKIEKLVDEGQKAVEHGSKAAGDIEVIVSRVVGPKPNA